MLVEKRNGKTEQFDKTKIIRAVNKAFIEVDGELSAFSLHKCEEIANYIEGLNKDFTVEEIQDIVEDKLMASNRKDVARSYVRYRYKRELVREGNTTDKSIFELLNGISDYWNSENANKNAKTVTTQRDYLAGITSTDITRRFLLAKDIVEAHDAGIIHFHDADYFGQNVLSNCFSRDTKFITEYGLRRFGDFRDGETVKVKDKDGIWRTATVRNYGKQKMYDVTFSSGRTIHKITCTKNHRWILKDGSVTTNLNIGDSIYLTQDTTHYEPKSFAEKKYFCYGAILADGSDVKTNGVQYAVRIRLCGERKNKYRNLFKETGYTETTSYGDDKEFFSNKEFSKQKFLDYRVWEVLPLELKVALFNGYYMFDGNLDRDSICTADERLLELINDISCLSGYYVVNQKKIKRNTNYKNNAILYNVSFIKSQPTNRAWKVVSIVPHFNISNTSLNAWCVEEPITHSFMLEGGIVTGNCCLINLNDMLQNGTIINGVMIEKPHKLLTACTIATQIILGVSSSQYGGCTISLTHLAPFVRDSYNAFLKKYKDAGVEPNKAKELASIDLKKEVAAGVQTFNYQVNSMTNTNGQAPFLSVFMYLGETDEYKEELAMLIEEFLKQRILGFKNEKGVYVTPAFPKLLYVLEEDNIHEDSKYYYLTKLAAKCTAKRMVPDYISEKIMKRDKINARGEGECYACMGCRSFLTPWRTKGNPSKALDYTEGKGKYYGRFNQGVVTINLPDVALTSGKDMELFWKILDERLELCHRALQTRYKRLSKGVSDMAPIMWQNGALARLDKGESIEKLLKNGYSTLSLGFAGLYECVKYMTGHSHTDEAEGEEFAFKVMNKLNDACKRWKEEEDIDYSVYGTPIESTTAKFATKLKERFGKDIFVEMDGKDRNYITNSYHVFVNEEIDPFTKLALESKFQKLSPGGAISYIECADLTQNTEAVIEVMKFIYDNIMYAELNTKSDYCQECGYDGEIKIIDKDGKLDWQCPNCGNEDHNKMNVARRTCGYIGVNFFNQGRTDEIRNRYVHLDNHVE